MRRSASAAPLLIFEIAKIQAFTGTLDSSPQQFHAPAIGFDREQLVAKGRRFHRSDLIAIRT
jgi:hypothetical protein